MEVVRARGDESSGHHERIAIEVRFITTDPDGTEDGINKSCVVDVYSIRADTNNGAVDGVESFELPDILAAEDYIVVEGV